MNSILKEMGGARAIEARRHQDGGEQTVRVAIADEVPVALHYNESLFAVMMATPLDLEDFALGFSLSEGLVERPSDLYVAGIAPTSEDDGYQIFMAVPQAGLDQTQAARRALPVGSGCGLCGTSSLAQALRPLPPVASGLRIPAMAIRRAMADLPSFQALNRRVKAVHAAAFADAEGRILALREDVGRHNALDKLIGHLAGVGIDPGSGFAVMSSRCSFELVHKAAAAGIPAIATISAPTSLAADFAAQTGVAVAAQASWEGFSLYSAPWRITGDDHPCSEKL